MKFKSIIFIMVCILCSVNSAQANLSQNQVSQLYISIFGRASEGEGNTYWQTTQDDMVVAADTMLATGAAQTYFGTTFDDDQAFIEFIYKNTLGKTYAEDSDGVDYWVGELASGKTKGQVVATLINAAMDPLYAGLPEQNQFINKVTVCNYTADTIYACPNVNDLSVFVGAISGVTDDTATVTAAKNLITSFIDGDGEYPPQEGNFTNYLGMTFVQIEPGTFMMGSPEDELEGTSYETQHQVTLTQGYYMQTTEVTQGQWTAVMGSNPSYFSSCGDECPVEWVSWDNVQEFITKMNQRGEGTYALPTEAQWEYAARAGSTTAFANGDITETGSGYDPNLDAMGWYYYNSNLKTHLVAQKTPNAWGLYDMHGNVYEWCQDWACSFNLEFVTDPSGPSSGSSRVVRGGGWGGSIETCRSAYRGTSWPGRRNYNLGFRLVFFPGQQ